MRHIYRLCYVSFMVALIGFAISRASWTQLGPASSDAEARKITDAASASLLDAISMLQMALSEIDRQHWEKAIGLGTLAANELQTAADQLRNFVNYLQQHPETQGELREILKKVDFKQR